MQRTVIRDDEGRATLRPCPGCWLPRVLMLVVLDVDERRVWEARHGVVDITAAALPPEQRAAAMQRQADTSSYGVAMPMISCVTCGYDGLYTFTAHDG